MDTNTLQRMASDPAAFRAALIIPTDHGPALLGDVATELQRRDFAAMDGAWRRLVDPSAPEPGHNRFYFERGRGGSKTGDLAAMAAWALVASRRRLRLVAAAADQDQSKLLADAIDGLRDLNPWLAAMLQRDKYRVANVRTASELEILSADAPSSYGLTPDAVLIDELTHWPAGSGEQLWHALFSAAAKKRSCIVCIISNAGFGKGESWQWGVRESARTSERWYFHRWPGPATWLDAGLLQEQRDTLPPPVYARLFDNQWTTGSGDALSPEWIDRAVVLSGPLAGREFGWRFCAGLDLSTRRDFSALVVVGRHVGGMKRRTDSGEMEPVSRVGKILADIGELVGEPGDDWRQVLGARSRAGAEYEDTPATGTLRLAAVELWKPTGGQIDLAEIEAAILRSHERFGLSAVAYDPWQCEYLSQRLRRAGVHTEEVSFTGGNLETMAREVLSGFRECRVELYDHSQLLSDLRNLSIVESSRGYRLESPRSKTGGHGDVGTAFCLALLAAKRLRVGPPIVNRPAAYLPDDDNESILAGLSSAFPRQQAAVVRPWGARCDSPRTPFETRETL